jgi:hypothetical protein
VLPRCIRVDLAPLKDTADASASFEDAAFAFPFYTMLMAMQLMNLDLDYHGDYLLGVCPAAEQ